MTVIVTDNRTTPSEADSTTGWVGTDAPVLFTADPNPVELTGSLGNDVSTETHDLYYGISSVDFTDTLVYVWVLAQGIMDTVVNGGIAVILYDGTNRIGYHIAGSDKAAFRYSNTNVGWQCLLLDVGSLPVNFTARAGSEASLTKTAITGFGAMYKTLAKAVGGSENCFTDVIRYGNGGLTITGGASGGTEGKFSEIATEDSSNATGKALGIIRELGADLYGLQGQLIFGDNVGTTATYFADIDATVIFEDRSIGTNKYKITIVGNTTGSTTFKLGLQVGTTSSGSNGCTLICPTGIGASFIASDADLQFLLLYGSTLKGFNNGVTLSIDATNAPNHKIYGCSFVGCGQINSGKTAFKNNKIDSTTDANGGWIIDSTTSLTNVSDLSFVSDGTGHAIYITQTGTYSFSNFAYTGYGADGTTDAIVYNNSGGLVTLNPTGGDAMTVLNGTSASTVINNTQVVTINVTDISGNVIPNARVRIEADTGGALPAKDVVTITASTTTASVAHTAHSMVNNDWVIIRGATNSQLYNGIFQISNVTTDAYDYTMAGSPPSPATGTITSTFRVMQELTTAGGIASENFNYTADQPIIGTVRKSSTSPLYQQGLIIGTITSTGFTTSVTMVSDE